MCGVVLCPHGTFPFLLSPFSPSAGPVHHGRGRRWVKTIKGLVVIAAVAYDLLSKKKKG